MRNPAGFRHYCFNLFLALTSFSAGVLILTWIGSVQGAIATWSNHRTQDRQENIACLITDPVATAPCTDDPIQA
jgi:hypothetical protein